MPRFRFFILIIAVLGAYGALFLNLYQLQIEKGEHYAAKAKIQNPLAALFENHRGNIFIQDRDKSVPAALNKQAPVIYAVPKEIEDLDTAVENMAPILNAEPEELRKIFTSGASYKILNREPTEGQIKKTKEANIRGVAVNDQDKRHYPLNNLAAHIVGFVAPGEDKIIGRYGIENYYDDLLVTGQNINLTIDRSLQAEAERVLKELIQKHSASGGTIIIQEPKTGKILALVNTPDFNLNNYSSAKIEHFSNPAIQAIYEPGSIFKVITMAAGIDSGAFTPDTTFYDTGQITFKDGKIIRNWDKKANGTVSMTNVIERSINTGAAFAEKKIGHKKFYSYLVKFGFNEPTGITLPGEINGNIKNLERVVAEIDFASASFGQSVAVTPLQVINAISAIANDGKLMRPLIIEGDPAQEIRQVVSPEAAKKVTAMMISAVRKAALAQVPKYTVAGKTGTAQIPDLKHGGYTEDVINGYVGFVPATDPRFTILLKLDRPAGAPLSGQTVVPAFRQLAQFVLNYYNIPPDDLTPAQTPTDTGSLNY